MAEALPRITGSTHVLPFSNLSPVDFERLCLALVSREGYERAEHVGASGSDGGRDIVAHRNGRQVVFQCKRYQTLQPKDAEAVVEKILSLPEKERPNELILVTSCMVSSEARERARTKAGSIDFQVWALTELDERVNRHPDLVARFFQIPSQTTLSKRTPEAGSPLRERLVKKTLRWGRGVLVIAMLMMVAGWLMLEKYEPAVSSERGATFSPASLNRTKVPLRPSLAVMTFENRSGDGSLDWLSTAFAEAVSAKLGLTGDIRAVDRLDVSFVETDLLLDRPSVLSSRNLERIRNLLGVEFVLGGAYDTTSGPSQIRLALTLYDTRKGIAVAETQGRGEVSNWLNLADSSTGDRAETSIRRALQLPPAPPSQERLRALFPKDAAAARLYFQGLEHEHRFDPASSLEFFRESAKIDLHPLALAALAKTHYRLGQLPEGSHAIRAAMNTSRDLPETFRREIEIIDRKLAFDYERVAESVNSLFRDLYADDLSFGLRAAQAFVEAGSPGLAKPIIEELRRLPFAEKHPGIELLEADALLVQQNYKAAQGSAERAIDKARALGAIRHEALARTQLATILSYMGCPSQAVDQCRKARDGFRKTGDLKGEAQCLEHTALYYQGFDIHRAEEYYREAISRYEDLGDQQERRRVLGSLNSILTQMGRTVEAEGDAQEAPLEEGMASYEDGRDFYSAGNLDGAETKFNETQKTFSDNRLPDDEAIVLAHLGEIKLIRGKPKEAYELYSRALDIHEKIGSAAYVSDLVGLGRVYVLEGKYPAAKIRLDEAVRWLRSGCNSGSEPEAIALHDVAAWAEAFLALAELELLSGNIVRSEGLIRSILDQEVRDLGPFRSRALSLEARLLLTQDKVKLARERVTEAGKLTSGDFRALREAEITEARVLAAEGNERLAVEKLDGITSRCADAGQVLYELESSLAAGKIELERINGSRSRLENLRDRAAELQIGQVVRRIDSTLRE